MTRKKIILIIVTLLSIILLIYWRQSKTVNIKNQKISEIGTKDPETSLIKITKPILENRGVSIIDYGWELVNLELPTETVIYEINDRKIDGNLIKKFTNYFGFTDKPIIDNESLIAFENDSGEKNFYVNKKDLIASYHVNLVENNINPKDKRLSNLDLEKKLKDIVKSTVDWPSGLVLETSKIEKQQIVDMSYKSSNSPDSRIVYLEMYYKLGNLKVLTNKGIPITARFFDDGTLLSLAISLPFINQKDISKAAVKSIEEVKRLRSYDFLVLSSNSKEEADVIIKKVRFKIGYLAYLYKISNNILQPYIIFEGDGVVVGVPALVDSAYN